MNCEWESDDSGTKPYSADGEYGQYIQATHWQLVTIRVNLAADGGLIPDFSDFLDFTYCLAFCPEYFVF